MTKGVDIAAGEGMVFNIQKFSTEDGPGIRTTVFMKGCPLHCLWCHNPESISGKPELVWYGVRCIGDRGCLNACKQDALSLEEGGMRIDRERCTVCGECADACPARALEIIGKRMSRDEVMAEVLKDKVFYRNSGGGVTFSGGEPTLQKDFLRGLLILSKEEGLHTALDTCGQNRREVFEEILPYVDLVLYDLKAMDEEVLRRATGAGLERILDNIRFIDSRGIPLWVRTPVIPGYTDAEENIASIARFIRRELHNVERYDLLAFSNLCGSKYEQLGMEFSLRKEGHLFENTMKRLKEIAEGEGIGNVVISGPMKRA